MNFIHKKIFLIFTLLLSQASTALRGSLSSSVTTVNSETTLELDIDFFSQLLANSYIQIKFNRDHYETYFD